MYKKSQKLYEFCFWKKDPELFAEDNEIVVGKLKNKKPDTLTKVKFWASIKKRDANKPKLKKGEDSTKLQTNNRRHKVWHLYWMHMLKTSRRRKNLIHLYFLRHNRYVKRAQVIGKNINVVGSELWVWETKMTSTKCRPKWLSFYRNNSPKVLSWFFTIKIMVFPQKKYVLTTKLIFFTYLSLKFSDLKEFGQKTTSMLLLFFLVVSDNFFKFGWTVPLKIKKAQTKKAAGKSIQITHKLAIYA